MGAAYYNEFDSYAAQWLRNLITTGVIAPGEVDERSIEDVSPDDLRDFTQCHFFAGIGVWSFARRQAGWSDDRRIWTGSCPCQPFSQAGKGKGFSDERHLWPAFFHLISECRPDIVVGEQVEAAVKQPWLDLVQTDLEGVGYTTGAICAPAAGVGAPHIRSRIYWAGVANQFFRGGVGDSDYEGLEGWSGVPECTDQLPVRENGLVSGLAHSSASRCQNGTFAGSNGELAIESESRVGVGSHGIPSDGVGDSIESRCGQGCEAPESARHGSTFDTASWTNGFWKDADWLPFRDSKFRPVEPGTFPMAPRTSSHVGRCRAYGNAIVAPLATEFIKAVISIL